MYNGETHDRTDGQFPTDQPELVLAPQAEKREAPSLIAAIHKHFQGVAVNGGGVSLSRAERARGLADGLADAIALSADWTRQEDHVSVAAYAGRLGAATRVQFSEALDAFRYSHAAYSAQLDGLRADYHRKLSAYPPDKYHNSNITERYFQQRNALMTGYRAARAAIRSEVSGIFPVHSPSVVEQLIDDALSSRK